MTPPLYTDEWFPLWEAAAECQFPISFHSTGFKALRAPDTPEQEQKYFTQWRLVRSALFQLDTMEVLVSLLASGACEKYPDFNFVLGESGVTWLPYVFATANRLLRLYVSTSQPSQSLVILAEYIMKVYAPLPLPIKLKPQCYYGATHCWKATGRPGQGG